MGKLSIRKTKTASGATAVQVVRHEKRRVIVVKHIGSGKTDEEIVGLIESAEAVVRTLFDQPTLFAPGPRRNIALATVRYLGITYTFAHEILSAVSKTIGFEKLASPILLDFAYLRLIEPCSKLRSIELLERYFGIRHAERTVYRALKTLAQKKEKVEAIAVEWAQQGLSSDLSLVLYDVTTLYFETFESDDLRIPGFSKDNKSQQPQIVIGLLVNREGFPLGYEVFKGNTFEGHTMLPVLETFAKAHNTVVPTVVADAAMISRENIRMLAVKGYSYIVGARLGNASPKIIAAASAGLARKDDATLRITTEHGELVCAFSSKRYRKDKADMDAQVKKAKTLVKKGEPGKRAKFVHKENDTYSFDDALYAKTQSLLGIKGYYTNIPASTLCDADIIARYRDLWHVEASFRMSKNDLAARPIFHRKKEAIRAHLLICFVALAMGKHIELATQKSLHAVKDILWSVTDARIADTVSGETFTLRSELSADAREIAQKLCVSY